MVIDWGSFEEYPINTGVLYGSIVGSSLFLYVLMILLIILSRIMLSILILLLSVWNIIGPSICSKNLSWLLNLNLIFKMLWAEVKKSLLISMYVFLFKIRLGPIIVSIVKTVWGIFEHWFLYLYNSLCCLIYSCHM